MRAIVFAMTLALSVLIAVPAMGNSVSSSTMEFEGTLTDNGDGTYSGVIPMIDNAGYDIYGEEGGTAWFGNDPGSGPVWTSQAIGADHDAWPTWTPDTPDWYQYSLELYVDGSTDKWAVRNHPGADATHPWYDEGQWGAGGLPAKGVPMSGVMDYSNLYAAETDLGAYLPGTGTPEIPGGAAGYGGGPAAWDMDWSWGSEVVPLEYAGFDIDIQEITRGTYQVTLTPTALTEVWVDDDYTSVTPGWGGTHFATIQDAVDAIDYGTVNVAAGEYVEQVHITKDDVDIVGAGDDVVTIKSPATLTEFFTTSGDNYPIVFVDGATGVDIYGVTIDGDGQGNANPRFVGLGFWNGDGSLNDATVINVMETPFSGAQHGVGVYANNDGGGPYALTLTDVDVEDFQKNGVTLAGAGLTATLTRVDAVGQGHTSVTAQNGIQVSSGAEATLEDCTVSDIGYTGTGWVACGFLFIEAGQVDMTGSCSVSNSQTSVAYQETDGSVAGLSVSSGGIDSAEGIRVIDYGYSFTRDDMLPDPVSPFGEFGPGARGTATTVTMSDITLTGVHYGGDYGLSLWSLGDDVSVTVSGADLTDWEYGVVAYEDGSTIAVDVSSSSIVSNDFGYWTNSADVQGGEFNWWGDAAGPTTAKSGDGVSEKVDYSPWYADVPGTSPMPLGTDDSIQDAIDAAAPGGVVTVGPGTYDEMLSVDKALTLRGANWGIHPAIGTHPTEVVGTRGPETILSHNGMYALRPAADDITLDGFMFTGDGGRIIDTYADANDFHLTNCIFDNDAVGTTVGVIQFGGGSHTGALFDFNLFQDRGDHTLYNGGGPWDGLTIEYNKFNVEGDAVFWAASPLVDGVIRGNEFDGTIGGTPGLGFCTVNIGQGGNMVVEDNYVHDVQYSAFQIGIIDGAVRDNVFERIYPYPGYWGTCFELWGGQYGTAVSDNVEVTGNVFNINDVAGAAEPSHGLRLRAPESGSGIDGSTIVCRDNLFLDGGEHPDCVAIWHQGDTTTDVDAEQNWWGDPSGPTHTSNPTGTGASSGDHVDFDPWLGGNIYCDPDPLDITEGMSHGDIDVEYLGGGSGLLYSYSVT
ncbi:MAG: hypothetical protein GF400_06270, partial [Candidatus Eisenbacteria bacterium]|nr:hypothetical protein [Candidatus Eisenbacteria bacterium]